MSIQNAYDDWSLTYDTDENFTRDLDGAITQRTLGHRQYRSILELGCGTGKNTALFARLAETVYAFDFSSGMMSKARDKVQADNLHFAVADITKPWPCRDSVMDLVVCNLVLEHIADLTFIFAQAARTLMVGGQLFISELHPFRQYQGTKARFQQDRRTRKITAFTHHISDFLAAAAASEFRLLELQEWWHENDGNQPPRLVSFLFAEGARSQ